MADMIPTLEETRADIAKRNAGAETLTIWKDGSWLLHGFRDAEIATRCEPDQVLLSIRLDTMVELDFSMPLQAKIDMYEKILGAARE